MTSPYRSNLYDDGALDYDEEPFEEQDLFGVPGSPKQPSSSKNKDASQRIPVSTRSQSELEEQLRDLQAQYKESQSQVEKWRGAFKDVAISVGVPVGREPDSASVISSIQSLKQQCKLIQDEIKNMRKREAALQIQLAEKSMESIELRRELNVAWQTSEPPIVQLKQLLLDPAVNREFLRLKSDLAETQSELKRVQSELEAVTFTQESKIGRQLMTKCRTLQEENEEMGRELSEGKVHQLQTQLTMAKDYAEEMRKTFLELEDHCSLLDEEAEELQKEIFVLRRQVREYEVQLAPSGLPLQRGSSGRGMDSRGIDNRSMDRKRMMPLDRDMGPPHGRGFPNRKRGR